MIRLPALLVGAILALMSAPALTFPAGALSGQAVEREEQVPLLPDRGILHIGPELRDALNLFPDFGPSASVRLLLRADGVSVLEIEAVREGRVHRERRLLAPEELAQLRTELSARLDAEPTSVPGQDALFARDGRGGLVLGQTLLGLGFHGWAVPVALDMESTQAAVATYLLTAGTTFYIPYRWTRDREVTEAHRDLAMYGGSRGILYGALLGDALAGSGADDPERIRLGAGVLAGLGGSILGFVGANRYRPDEGTAALWGLMGDFGLAAGAATSYVAGPYTSRDVVRTDGEFEYIDSELRHRVLGHALTLSGGAVGVAVGKRMGDVQVYSEGNVHALRSGGVLGAQMGLTLTRALGTDDARAVTAGALVGGLGGLWSGHRILAGRRYTDGEGLLINAGHIAGAATALGATYLITEEIDDHPVLYLATGTAGSLLGAGLVYRALGSGSGPLSMSGSSGEAGRRTLTLVLRPEHLLWNGTSGTRHPLPIVSLHF